MDLRSDQRGQEQDVLFHGIALDRRVGRLVYNGKIFDLQCRWSWRSMTYRGTCKGGNICVVRYGWISAFRIEPSRWSSVKQTLTKKDATSKIYLVHDNITHKYIVFTYFLSYENQIILSSTSSQSLPLTHSSKVVSIPATCYQVSPKLPSKKKVLYLGNFTNLGVQPHRIYLPKPTGDGIPFHLFTTKQLYQAQTQLSTPPSPHLKWDFSVLS
jgi:hypothetical protein